MREIAKCICKIVIGAGFGFVFMTLFSCRSEKKTNSIIQSTPTHKGKWEIIQDNHPYTKRLKVEGGWLYLVSEQLIFVKSKENK